MNFHFMNLLEGLDDQKIIPPTKNGAPEDADVLGEVPDDLRKIYSRMTEKHRLFERVALDCQHCDDEEQAKELGKKAIGLKRESNLLLQIFYHELDHHLNLLGESGGISLDKDWQIFREPPNPLTRLLDGFVAIDASDQPGRHCGPGCPCHAEKGASEQVN